MGRLLALALASTLTTACSDGRGSGQPGIDGGGGDLAGMLPGGDALVYSHTASVLYTVDPDNLAVNPVGAFQWPNAADEMTDIAIDRDGKMIGISYTAVYGVDKATAACTYLAAFAGGDFNGLSFISTDQIDAVGGAETLVGAAIDGSVYRIDPNTGAQTKIGSYGPGLGSSGDLVSVLGATYATVRGAAATDVLVKVDVKTGKATQIGATGYNDIWGLGYWKQRLFGFTQQTGMVTIDVNTGVASPAVTMKIPWYGAGVTTAAPTTVN